MSAQTLTVHASTLPCKAETNRRSANYHPSIWGDLFLSHGSDFTSTDNNIEQQTGILKEKVRTMLMATVDKPSQKLNFIDAIQRLGVSYHYESEIDEVLQEMHKTHLDNDEDLHTVALQFRLLRQQGYYISCDMFNKFKDTKGNFKKCLTSDVKGMLSLYEATHLRVHGEDILDEALAFTITNLESMVTHLSPPRAEQVSRALNRPIRKSLQRLEAYYYISNYQEDPSHDKVLLMFAKLDFNQLQKMHLKELSDISKWWKDLDFATKLPFARDRVVECYFWILGVYFEPQYALARKITIKVISMTSIIDDTYDVYGTLEELQLFTDAIDRWDISCIDTLPEYMKHIYKALIDVYAEIEEEMSKQGRSYCVHYAKQAMKNQVQAYFVEAKWFNEAYVPTMEEYMPIALVSCGYYMLSTTCFIGMGEIVTKEVIDWVFNHPKIVTAASIINRLMDDIVSNKFEQERGHVASGIECYMKQHGVSEQFVCDDFKRQVIDAWKDINQEFLRPTEVPIAFLMRVLNFSRVMEVLYKTGDGYTHVGEATKSYIASLLINPLQI